MKRRDFLKVSAVGAAATAVCLAGDRAILARVQVAHDVELPEVARHHLWRRRAVVEIRRRDDRQQVSDPGLRRRRTRAGPAGAGCDLQRHRRDVPHRLVLLRRQGSDLCDLCLGAVRPQRAPAEFLVVSGRRQGTRQRVLQEVRRDRLSLRQHRHPDGRLVPQGDQDGCRSVGPQDAHRRHRRTGAAEGRRRAAAACRRRHLSGARKGHHRCGRMGRSL